jgi:hypothetical protein
VTNPNQKRRYRDHKGLGDVRPLQHTKVQDNCKWVCKDGQARTHLGLLGWTVLTEDAISCLMVAPQGWAPAMEICNRLQDL